MKLKMSLCLLALVALAVAWIPTATASSALAPSPEIALPQEVATLNNLVETPMCRANLTFVELPDILRPAQAAGGCGPSQCNSSCRAQGYDFGTCFLSTCICRFYFP